MNLGISKPPPVPGRLDIYLVSNQTIFHGCYELSGVSVHGVHLTDFRVTVSTNPRFHVSPRTIYYTRTIFLSPNTRILTAERTSFFLASDIDFLNPIQADFESYL